MPIIKFGILGAVIFLSTAFAFAQQPNEPLRFKNGRQYALDLARRLEVPDNELSSIFRANRDNAPKEGDMASLTSGMNALARVATEACTYTGYFDKDKATLESLYQQILDRPPTELEIQNAIRTKDGKLHYFANCFEIAMKPEFITIKLREEP